MRLWRLSCCLGSLRRPGKSGETTWTQFPHHVENLEARVGIGQEMVLAVPTPRPTTTHAISDPSPDRQRNRL